MTRHPVTTTALNRRDNALETIRSDARAAVTGGRRPANYNNARRILTAEFGYTDAQVAEVWANAKNAAR